VEGTNEDWSQNSTISIHSNQAPVPGPCGDWNQNLETASIPEIFHHPDIAPIYNYCPEEDGLTSPPSYSPVVYEDLNPFAPLEISIATPERPSSTIRIEYSHFLPASYGYPREE